MSNNIAGAVDHLWVEASDGEIPTGAVVGGEENGESVYIIRAKFKTGLIPGKLVPSNRKAYIPWSGKGHAVQTYQVLCDFEGTWVRTTGKEVPSNAFSAGESESKRPETLYVGRAVYDGYYIVGKYHPSHGVLYIVNEEKEIPISSNFEVLCRK